MSDIQSWGSDSAEEVLDLGARRRLPRRLVRTAAAVAGAGLVAGAVFATPAPRAESGRGSVSTPVLPSPHPVPGHLVQHVKGAYIY